MKVCYTNFRIAKLIEVRYRGLNQLQVPMPPDIVRKLIEMDSPPFIGYIPQVNMK